MVTGRRLLLQRLTEAVLASNGELPLRSLLESVVPVGELRALARKFSLSPKGFRLEKAPAKVLAPLLADLREGDELEEVVDTLLSRLAEGDEKQAAAQPSATPRDLGPLLELREQELARARQKLSKAQEAQARARGRADHLQRELRESGEQVTRLRRALEDETRRRPSAAPAGGDRDLLRRIRELERDLDALAESEEGLRRLLALRTSRIRALEEQLAELNELLPKGRRRRKRSALPEPEPEVPFALPYFTPSFYKSLEGKDRKSVEKAFQAILIYCTEGPAYPGLEAKQMGGQETWSLRAGIRHRVYFQPRADGDITVLAMADREDQHTTLRRLKDR